MYIAAVNLSIYWNRLPPAALCRTAAFGLLVAIFRVASATEDWMPPQHPDPSVILQEARKDTDSGDYKSALAKYEWFYDHATKFDEGVGAVRLSFALQYWSELADVFSPAEHALLQRRDAAAEKVFAEGDSLTPFQELTAINDAIGDTSSTVATFVRLDKKSPEIAKKVFPMAQRALIKHREFEIASRYIDLKEQLTRLKTRYHRTVEVAQSSNGKARASLLSSANRTLIREASTLVALLAIAGRDEEVDAATDTILQIMDSPELRSSLAEAPRGNYLKKLVRQRVERKWVLNRAARIELDHMPVTNSPIS